MRPGNGAQRGLRFGSHNEELGERKALDLRVVLLVEAVERLSGFDDELRLVHSADLRERESENGYVEREVVRDRGENRHILEGAGHLEQPKKDFEGGALRGKVWLSARLRPLPPHCRACEERVTRSSLWMLNSLRMVLGLPEKRAMMVKQSWRLISTMALAPKGREKGTFGKWVRSWSSRGRNVSCKLFRMLDHFSGDDWSLGTSHYIQPSILRDTIKASRAKNSGNRFSTSA